MWRRWHGGGSWDCSVVGPILEWNGGSMVNYCLIEIHHRRYDRRFFLRISGGNVVVVILTMWNIIYVLEGVTPYRDRNDNVVNAWPALECIVEYGKMDVPDLCGIFNDEVNTLSLWEDINTTCKCEIGRCVICMGSQVYPTWHGSCTMNLVRCVFDIVVDLGDEFETGMCVTACCDEAWVTVGPILSHECDFSMHPLKVHVCISGTSMLFDQLIRCYSCTSKYNRYSILYWHHRWWCHYTGASSDADLSRRRNITIHIHNSVLHCNDERLRLTRSVRGGVTSTTMLDRSCTSMMGT